MHVGYAGSPRASRGFIRPSATASVVFVMELLVTAVSRSLSGCPVDHSRSLCACSVAVERPGLSHQGCIGTVPRPPSCIASERWSSATPSQPTPGPTSARRRRRRGCPLNDGCVGRSAGSSRTGRPPHRAGPPPRDVRPPGQAHPDHGARRPVRDLPVTHGVQGAVQCPVATAVLLGLTLRVLQQRMLNKAQTCEPSQRIAQTGLNALQGRLDLDPSREGRGASPGERIW